MKSTFTLILICLCLNALCQKKEKISFFKDSKVKIISFVIDKNPNRLPVASITVQNNTKGNLIFTKVALILIECKKHPLSSSGGNDLISKALTPIAGLDLLIPLLPGTYVYLIQSPIQIVKKDAATFVIRIRCLNGDKNVVPSQIGYFKFKLSFITYDSKAVSTPEIELGN